MLLNSPAMDDRWWWCEGCWGGGWEWRWSRRCPDECSTLLESPWDEMPLGRRFLLEWLNKLMLSEREKKIPNLSWNVFSWGNYNWIRFVD